MDKKKILLASLFLNTVFIVLLYNTYVLRTGVRHSVEKFLRSHQIISYENVRDNKIHTDLYSLYRRPQANIVMLGDSVTQNVSWDELLDRNDVVNRGIGGDNTLGMLRRISFVYKLAPKICFIQGGVNDLRDGISVEEVFDQYKKIITGLKEHSIIPVVQSTFYSKNVPGEKIDQLNRLLKQYADHNDLYYMDLNKSLAADQAFKKEFTYDGTHLTAQGYAVWRGEVAGALQRHGL